MIKKIILKIEGIHCVSCALNIDFALEDLGVMSRTSYANSQTEIEFDPQKRTTEQIIKIIKEVGYEARIMTIIPDS